MSGVFADHFQSGAYLLPKKLIAGQSRARKQDDESEIAVPGGDDRPDHGSFAVAQNSDTRRVDIRTPAQIVNCRSGIAGKIQGCAAMLSRGLPNSPIVVTERQITALRQKLSDHLERLVTEYGFVTVLRS